MKKTTFTCCECGRKAKTGIIDEEKGKRFFICSECEKRGGNKEISEMNAYELLIYLRKTLDEFFEAKGI